MVASVDDSLRRFMSYGLLKEVQSCEVCADFPHVQMSLGFSHVCKRVRDESLRIKMIYYSRNAAHKTHTSLLQFARYL